MAGRREPPNSVIALIADIVRSRGRTRHAVFLLLSVGFATVLVLVPVLVALALFDGPAAATVIGVLTAAGLIGGRRHLRPP